jgi:hypothetical protein
MRRLALLVGIAGALTVLPVLAMIETRGFAGADTLVGVLGALAIGYTAKTLAAMGLTRPGSADDD